MTGAPEGGVARRPRYLGAARERRSQTRCRRAGSILTIIALALLVGAAGLVW